MNDEEHYYEENIARLIRAGFGEDAHPSQPIRTQLFQQLIKQLHKGSAGIDFPDPVLALLGGLLMFVAVWLLTQTLYEGESVTASVSFTIGIFWLGLNLALMPIVGFVILYRRRSHG